VGEPIATYCSLPPLLDRSHTPKETLESLSDKTFGLDGRYVQSDQERPREASSLLPVLTKYLPESISFGDNERFILSKLLSHPVPSPDTPVLQVMYGGLGTGKSRAIQFCTRQLGGIAHANGRFPHEIQFDFNTLPIVSLSSDQSQAMRIDIMFTIADRLATVLADLIHPEEELTKVWDAIFEGVRSRHLPHTQAFDFIYSRASQDGALRHNLAIPQATIIDIRRRIRQECVAIPERYFAYVAVLARHVNQSMYNDCPLGMFIVVDNIDPLPSLPQSIIIDTFARFLQLSHVPTLITARHGTMVQRFDFGQLLHDSFEHKGPHPLDVVKARIDDILKDPSSPLRQLPSEQAAQAQRGIHYIRGILESSRVFVSLFGALAGESVRKGLVLSQYLFNNNVYDICAKTEPGRSPNITISDACRAILVGLNDRYRWSQTSPIDNLFRCYTENPDAASPLIKTRCLLYLRQRQGEAYINDLVGALSPFGYDYGHIGAALSDMMLENKALIYSNHRIAYNAQEMAAHGQARLYLSARGREYLDHVITSLQYVEEVMLDVKVEDEDLGVSPNAKRPIWRIERLEQRIDLATKFVSYLADVDLREMEAYCGSYDYQRYVKDFDLDLPLTKMMLTAVAQSIQAIAGSIGSTDDTRELRNRLMGAAERCRERENVVIYKARALGAGAPA
jgi:hypothetical protein